MEHLLHSNGQGSRRGEDGAHEARGAHRHRDRCAHHEQSEEEQSDEDHRGPSGRQSWGSANRIIRAPPTGRAAKNQSWDTSRASVSCRCAMGAMRMPPATRMAPKPITARVMTRSTARRAPGLKRSMKEDDPDEAEARDLVVPLEGRLHHVPTEHAEEHVAHEDDHEDEADHLDEHVTWPRRGPRPPSDRKTPSPPWPRGISTPAARAPGTHGCPSPR